MEYGAPKASNEDVHQMLNVEENAFEKDPFITFCFGGGGFGDPTALNDRPIRKHLERIADARFMYHKAVYADDPEENMIGSACWYFSQDPFSETVQNPWPLPELSSPTQQACLDASLLQLRRWRVQYFKDLGQPYAHMIMLSVSPAAQRRGVGTALLQEGLREVDRRGLPTYISASPAGLELYKRHGWEEKFRTVINLKDYGGDDFESVAVALIRPAKVEQST